MRSWHLDIRAFQANSLTEWAGRISAIVFFGGCNWRCPYCHNSELLKETPFDPNDVLERINGMRKYLDGVVLSGGEATLQPDIKEFARAVRDMGLSVKLFTNGTRPDVIREMVNLDILDAISLDYKAIPELLTTLVGASREDVDAVNLSFLTVRSGCLEREYRTTLCPAVVTLPMLFEMADALNDEKGLWVLQQYEVERVLDAERSGERVFSDAELARIFAEVKKRHDRTVLRRGTR